jgi:hypothetical protein
MVPDDATDRLERDGLVGSVVRSRDRGAAAWEYQWAVTFGEVRAVPCREAGRPVLTVAPTRRVLPASADLGLSPTYL